MDAGIAGYRATARLYNALMTGLVLTLVSRKSAERARSILGGYASSIAQLRLQARGVNPLLTVPVAVNDVVCSLITTRPPGMAIV